MSDFDMMGLPATLVKRLELMGMTEPTPIQKQAIPHGLNGRDVMGLAQTGTGKTAAFGIPMMQLANPTQHRPEALILCPTRELCVQVTRDLMALASHLPQIKVTAVYGGAPIEPQIRALRQGSQIVVATPGRLNDLLRRNSVDLSTIRRVVLDEADEMLNMGFKEELNTILAATPAEKNTLLFSATMSREVAAIAANYMNKPMEITVGQKNVGTENVRHIYYMVQAKDRYQALKRIADLNPDIYAIIFCRTRQETQEVAEKLIGDGYSADALHGDLSQGQRDHVMNKFRGKSMQMLVATDVAARGLDVSDLTHVINYNLPDDPASYTHRSGRTGRAGKTGISIVIINLRELFKVREIERRLQRKFEAGKLPSGQQVCERQLLNLIDTVNKVQVDHARIEPFLPAVYEKLADLDREELIKRFVSLEFNRFLEYYRNAPDLNASDKGGRDDSDRTGRGMRTDDKRPARRTTTSTRPGTERPWQEKPAQPWRDKPTQPWKEKAAEPWRDKPAQPWKDKPAAPSSRTDVSPTTIRRKPLELADFLEDDDNQPSYRKPAERPATGRPAPTKYGREASTPARPEYGDSDRERGDSTKFTRFFLNVGKQDGVHAGRLIGEINDKNFGVHIKFGKIEVKETTSVVEIDGRYTEQVLKSFANVQINGKPVAIEAAGEARPRPSRPAAPAGWAKPAYKSKGKPPAAGVRKGPGSHRPPEVDKARRKVQRKPWEK
ncbi:MAG TPA: DEAD/DEAH box helicase [Desulfurivibrionaceae bacterium]|nr:DEAD/DEAH box helicase [Desulfurivibrionaceae bacterium]